MKYQVRELSPTKQANSERTNASSVDAAMELGDEELSKASGGRLHCVQGQHIKSGRITC